MLLLNSSLEDGVCFIETAALDGEKNLKRKVSDELTVQMYSEMLGQYRGQLSCMKPNAQLYHFEGSMELGQARVKFNNGNSLLLRGAKLKNTKWVVGLVIYVGVDSKVMRNSDEPLLKQSQVERKVNLLLVLILCLQLSLALLCAVGDAVFYNLVFAEHAWYLSPPVAGSIYVEGVVAFFSHLVLFNTMIPISLVVSMEIIKFTQAYLISNDILMRSLTTRQGSKAFTSTLNEELGQIEYVFSDKTGTLTCNVMEFKLCLIGGELFGSKGVLSKE